MQSQATRSWKAGGQHVHHHIGALDLCRAQRGVVDVEADGVAVRMIRDKCLGEVGVDIGDGDEPVLLARQLEQVRDQERRTLARTEDEDLFHDAEWRRTGRLARL